MLSQTGTMKKRQEKHTHIENLCCVPIFLLEPCYMFIFSKWNLYINFFFLKQVLFMEPGEGGFLFLEPVVFWFWFV